MVEKLDKEFEKTIEYLLGEIRDEKRQSDEVESFSYALKSVGETFELLTEKRLI